MLCFRPYDHGLEFFIIAYARNQSIQPIDQEIGNSEHFVNNTNNAKQRKIRECLESLLL